MGCSENKKSVVGIDCALESYFVIKSTFPKLLTSYKAVKKQIKLYCQEL